MTTFAISAADGLGELEDQDLTFVIDLSREQIDVYGTRWSWTGDTDTDGTPFMRTGDDTPQRLSHVHWTAGPLIPAPRPVTRAEALAAIAVPACTAAEAQAGAPSPTPLTFARFANRLRLRGRSA
ncbi:phiSA1p31-related protein [Streptomyces sp. NPDC086838]|uniref:phiSA1p31-related protein n=1 Tax=Streptomyces sp. NPDC086838 TaxID=3365762 RepID=UPI0037F157E6